MTVSAKHGGELLALVKAQLLSVSDELAAGNDVAPATRFQLEALIEQALDCRDVWSVDVLAEIEAMLPAGSELIIGNDSGLAQVALQLWQRRAPVVPTTAD